MAPSPSFCLSQARLPRVKTDVVDPGPTCFFHWQLTPGSELSPPVCLHLTHGLLKSRHHISFTQCLVHSRCSLNAY